MIVKEENQEAVDDYAEVPEEILDEADLAELEEVKKENDNWLVKTNNGTFFSTPNVIIAGGVGSFEPRKFSVKECEKFENKSLFYSVKDKKIFKTIFVKDKIINYIINNCNRDLFFLCAFIRNLDDVSLSAKKRITIPFIKKVIDLISH